MSDLAHAIGIDRRAGELDPDRAGSAGSIDGPERRRGAPGRATVTARMPPSARSIARALVSELRDPVTATPVVAPTEAARGPWFSTGSFLDEVLGAPAPLPASPAVQCATAATPAAATASDVHAAAAYGTSGSGSQLPFLDEVQRAFGHHDVSRVLAHVGGAAADASAAIGARGYAVGDHVAFAAAPDLHLAAHEAAHVVQQRGGVRLSDGVGRAGDEYERHADAVADAVVRGESAQVLLDGMAHRGAAGGPAVQRDPPRAGDPPPATGAIPTPGPTSGGAHAPFDTLWTLDYHGRYRGANQTPGARTSSSAMMVQGLAVAPTEGDARGHTFRGLHTRDSGPVELGHYRHPANQGGRVTANVSYVTDRALHLQVQGVARAEGATVASQIRAGLEDELITGDVSAQAMAQLTDAQRARGIAVTANLQPGSVGQVEPAPANYGAVDHDGQQLNVLVDIPMGTRDRQTQGRREHEGQTAATVGREQQQTAQTTRAITDTDRQLVTQSIERSYLQRVNQIAVDVTQHVVAHTRLRTWQFQANAQGQLGLSAALNGQLDAAGLIGRLPGGLGLLVARFLPQITMTVTPTLQVTVAGQIQHTRSNTDEERQLTERRQEIQQAVEQSLRSMWSQQTEHTRSLVTTVTATQGDTNRAGAELRTRDLEATGYTDTIHIPVAAGAPTLSVTSGARGGGPPTGS